MQDFEIREVNNVFLPECGDCLPLAVIHSVYSLYLHNRQIFCVHFKLNIFQE
jgi:hypothetical protein